MNNNRHKRILLTGASGWFGQSFIAEYLKIYGAQRLKNLYLTTSNGRSISHPLLDFKLPTITNSMATTINDLDLIVHSSFLTKEKIISMGIESYNKQTENILNDFEKILQNNSNAVVCVISSGAVYGDTSQYGLYKRIEEDIAKNSLNNRVLIFRIFGATTKYMDFRNWSAVCTFLKENLNQRDIYIKSNQEVLRGFVCMEDLSNIIIKYFESIKDNQPIYEVYDAVSDIKSIREIALELISDKIKVILPDNYDKNMKDYSYMGEKSKFLELSKRLNVNLKNCSKQLKNAQENYYIESYLN